MTQSENPGRIRWILVLWMFVTARWPILDRVNISIAGQFLQKDLNPSKTSLGFVFSAFVFGRAIFQAPGGRLADPRLVNRAGDGVVERIHDALRLRRRVGAPHRCPVLLGAGEGVVYRACPAGYRFASVDSPMA